MTPTEWDGTDLIYDNKSGRYFRDMEDLVEQLSPYRWGLANEITVPEECFLCTEQAALPLDIDHWDDQFDNDDNEAPDWLEQMVNEFNQKLALQPPICFVPDFNKPVKVKIPKE